VTSSNFLEIDAATTKAFLHSPEANAWPAPALAEIRVLQPPD
jgi:hypothetical protein